jgi:glutaconate CoA-transferase subunit A
MSKVVPLEQAASLVASGSTLGLGGMTLYRRPVTFVGALLQAGVTDLTLVSLTCSFESDLLVGAGRVRRVRTCYFGLEVFGLARHPRRGGLYAQPGLVGNRSSPSAA